MNKISVIKYLKERGASYRMMDDVSDFVGGYDSPLFIPTIEFIIDMNKALSMGVSLKTTGIDLSSGQNQENNPPQKYDPTYFANVSLEGAREHAKKMASVSSGAELEQQIRAVEYLEDMILQENEYMKSQGINNADNIKGKKSKNDKKQKASQRISDKIRREMSAFLEYLQDVTKSSQRGQKTAFLTNEIQQRQGQQGQQQQQQQQSQQNQQQSVRESRRRSSRLTNLLSAVSRLTSSSTNLPRRDSRTNAMGVSTSQKRTQQLLEKIDMQQHDHNSHDSKAVGGGSGGHNHASNHGNQHEASEAKQVTRDNSSKFSRKKGETKDSQKDSLASKAIDNVIKDKKEEKQEAAKESKQDSGGGDKKYTKGMESSAPKYDEAKVAKMDMKEAIKALKDVGVKVDSKDGVAEVAKKVFDAQLSGQLPLDKAPKQQR